MKKILIIGCSNGHNRHHEFRRIFQKTQSKANNVSKGSDDDVFLVDDYCEYTNLSMSGAGNTYIRHRLFDYLKDKTPDYVYLQFSGLIRKDIYFLKEAQDIFLASATHSYKIVDNKIFMVGGNLLDSRISDFQKKIFSMMYSTKDTNINNYESLQEVFLSLSILEKLNIKHNFTFYYDPTNPPTEATRQEGTINKFPHYINCDKLLPSPLNFAIENGYNVPDGVHFDDVTFFNYLENNKEKINIDLDDK